VDDLTIRPMTSADADIVTSLVISSHRVGGEGFYSEVEVEAFARTIAANGLADRPRSSHQLVAVVRGRILGTAGWVAHGEESARLTLVVVDPDHFGAGVGRRLVEAAEAGARAAGARDLVVRSSLNAIGFYEKLGYAVVEPWSTELDTLEIASMLMRKPEASSV
jgi:putative acetyltransferase